MTDKQYGGAPESVETKKPRKRRRKRGQMLLWILGPAIVLIVGGWFFLAAGRYVSTDNAYLHAHVITIAPQVGGRVADVDVQENQYVHKGDVLFRIESQPYQLAVDKFKAQAAAIGDYLAGSRDTYTAAQADLRSKQAALKHDRQQYQRIKALRAKGVVSQKDLDDAANDVADARGARDTAAAEVAKAKATLGGKVKAPVKNLAGYKAIEAQLAAAQLDVDHTVVRAPADGIIGDQSLEAGDFLQVGQAAMPLVTTTLWVEANFKETDLTWVQPGQSATVDVDTFPGHEWTAVISSLSPASGAEFSVLPAQNATGNWVKIVQRIPVRLNIQHPGKDGLVLRAGMSAEVEIDTGPGHRRIQRWLGLGDDHARRQARASEPR